MTHKVQYMAPFDLVKATPDSGAYDLVCTASTMFHPGHLAIIPTNLFTAFDGKELVAIIKERSGLALKGFEVKAGVIDGDYRKGWGVIMKWSPPLPLDCLDFESEHGQKCRLEYAAQRMRFVVGDKVAQVIFVEQAKLELIKTDQLPPPAQVHEGFGSTTNRQIEVGTQNTLHLSQNNN